MTERDLSEFHDSFSRASRTPAFFDRFYERFLASSPEVREKFRDTDFRRQKVVLRRSLLMIMDATVRRRPVQAELQSIAIRHGRRGLDVPPHLCDLWLDTLVETVREFDPHFRNGTKKVWRDAFRPAIDYMTSLY